MHGGTQQYAGFNPIDLNLLAMLTSPALESSHAHPPSKQQSRRPVGVQDPLILAAAGSAGPELVPVPVPRRPMQEAWLFHHPSHRCITRNHYLHDFFPQPYQHSLAYSNCDEEVVPLEPPPPRPGMVSQQAPRRERLALEQQVRREELRALNTRMGKPFQGPVSSRDVAPANSIVDTRQGVTLSDAATSSKARRRLSVSDPDSAKILRHSASPAFQPRRSASTVPGPSVAPSPPELVVQCQVRTRIPTPHGHVYLYLYKNNHDDKEHLAFVADQAQMDAEPGEVGPSQFPFLRSRTLDSVWRDGETEMERIVRGAYTGRLSAQTIVPSAPSDTPSTSSSSESEPPMVRIHSECFTGETIGSQRCDCGEQLDEAFRLITEAQRGVVVYLRQEGRGIGLLEKMRAYNLQDLGHDTVTANLLLGHGADMRTYDIAGAILQDLAVPAVKLLTNNPDKIEQIEKEGITVVERVAMVPRSWTAPARKRSSSGKRAARARLSGAKLLALAQEEMFASSQAPSLTESSDDDIEYEEDFDEDDLSSSESDGSHGLRQAGVGMIGASVTRSAELEKYLRTKVERMGHMLSPPPTPPTSRADSPLSRAIRKKATKSGRRNDDHPLASSIVSMVETDTGSVNCGSGCEDCEAET